MVTLNTEVSRQCLLSGNSHHCGRPSVFSGQITVNTNQCLSLPWVARASEDKLSDSGVDKHSQWSATQISRGGESGVNSWGIIEVKARRLIPSGKGIHTTEKNCWGGDSLCIILTESLTEGEWLFSRNIHSELIPGVRLDDVSHTPKGATPTKGGGRDSVRHTARF